MEYCEQTLRSMIDDKSLWKDHDDTHIWDMFYQIVDAVKYLHSIPFVHRDLKPSNIFISGSSIKLGDFGLGKQTTILNCPSNEIHNIFFC